MSRRCKFYAQVEEKENAQGMVPSKFTDQQAKPLEQPAEKNKITPLLPTWEAQCQTCLGASQALAVLKAV